MIQVHGITSAGESPHVSSDKDAALAVVSEFAQEIDPVVEKRVLRKIDLYLMPAMLIGQLYTSYLGPTLLTNSNTGYGMVYYDKVR